MSTDSTSSLRRRREARRPSGSPAARWPGRLVATLLLATLGLGAATWAQMPPQLTAPVNDFAGVIDAASAAELDRLIRALQGATGDTVVVATVRSSAPFADIRELAVKMFENRGAGIGEQGRDNGLLVLVAVEDRRVWVEVGYGLEGAITDGFAGQVSRSEMTPLFREGEYGRGLVAGVSSLMARIAEERGVSVDDLPELAAHRPRRLEEGIPPQFLFFLVILVILILLAAANQPKRRRRGRYWGGPPWSGWSGGYGGFGGGMGGFGGGGGFGGFGGGRSGGGGGGASW